MAGVANFGFIIFQAAGAYVAASLALPPDTAQRRLDQIYIGLHPPFPIPLIGAGRARNGWRCPSRSWSDVGCAATSPRSGCRSPPAWLNLLVTDSTVHFVQR